MERWFIGVDPGLVHTGVVAARFTSSRQKIMIDTSVVLGTKVLDVTHFVQSRQQPVSIWIEDYRPRSHYQQDKKLIEFIRDLKKQMPTATVLDNAGVKKIVTRDLMELLDLWKFPVSTNHQDLRSAARIMLLGMLKVPEYNELLSNVVRDHLNGDNWKAYIF